MTAASGFWPEHVRESALVKALIAYASISWLLLQVVSTLIQGLGLPGWVFTGFLVILIAGLPILLSAVYFSTRVKGAAAASEPDSPLRKVTVRRAALGGGLVLSAWVVIVGAFMASWAFGVGPAASLLAAGTLNRSDPILIGEFANRTRDPLLASTVAEAVRIDLSQSNLVRIVDQADVGDGLERMGLKEDAQLDRKTARDLALREGMAAILEGDVSALGPATLLTVRLVKPKDGEVIAEYQERAKDQSELLDAVDRLSSTLRNKIGEPLTKLRVEPALAKVTTASLPALQAYTRANALHAAGHKEKAVVQLKIALGIDPSFPMAWRKLGALLADEYPAQAQQAYANAYALRDRLPERERELATGSYFKNVKHDLPQAMAAYQRVLANYPDDEIALNNLANLYTAFQKPEEALKLQLAVVRIAPRFAAYSNLFNSYVRLGQLDKAEETHAAAAKLYPDQKRIKFQPIILAFARGDYAQADALEAHFLDANAGKPELVNDLFVARYELKRGRVDRARAIFRERARIAAEKGKLAQSIEAMTSLVAIAASTGHPDEGRAVLAETLATYPLAKIPEEQRPFIDLAIAYAQIGDAGAAKKYLAMVRDDGSDESNLNYDQRRRAEGLIALAEGRFADSASILSQASAFGQCSTCLLFDLGLAQEAAGDSAKAAATYERYLHLAPLAIARGEQMGFVLDRLARLQRAAGNAEAAAATRKRLDALWNKADPTLLAALDQAASVPRST